jgi:hypothetical protein
MESLEPWSTQWGLAFSSLMPLSVSGLKNTNEPENRAKGNLVGEIICTNKLLPPLLFIPAFNIGYF